MKKLLMFMLLGMFLISFTSAFEIDNWVNYEKDDLKVRITNAFNLGADIGTAELKSHKAVDQIIEVGAGKDKVVMFYDFNFTEIYKDGLGEVEFIDMESDEVIEKEYHFVYWGTISKQKNTYLSVCNNYVNGTKHCEEQITGTYIEEEEGWVRLSSSDIPKGNVRIGLATDVISGQTIDGIWTVAGKRLIRHAVWTSGLNTGLKWYWAFEEAAGDFEVGVGLTTNNLSEQGAVGRVAGKIGNGVEFNDNVANWLNSTSVVGISGSSDRTTCFWAEEDVVANYDGYLEWGADSANQKWFILSFGGTLFVSKFGTDVSSGVAPTLNMDAHCLVYDGTTTNWYRNSISIANLTMNTINTFDGYLHVGLGVQQNAAFDGVIDELGIWNRTLTGAEVIQLWNGGAGMTYIGVFSNVTVTLNSPANDTKSSSSLINFNTTVNVTILEIVNVSLFIDGIINETNTSGFVGDYIFPVTFDDGDYNWSIRVVDNETSITNSETRTFQIDTTFSSIVVESPTGILGYNFIGGNETLNVTITDTNLDSCWYNYNGTNISIDGCLTGVKNSTNFTLEEGNYNMTIYANDSASNLNSTFISWTYNLTEISQTYPTTSVESATEIYTATLSYNSTRYGVISGILTLNDTQYVGTRTGSGDSAILTASAIMPSISTQTNLTAYWTMGLTDSGGTVSYNLTSHNVTVSIINLSLCDATNNVPFWNFTIYNETNLVEVNSTMAVTFAIRSQGSTEDNSFSFLDDSETNSTFDFCISPGTENYTADANIKLTKTGYVDKFYNYQEISISNSTREDSLYMMTTADSTSFIVHVVYVDSSDVAGAEVQVQRYYQGTGEWLTTEILTTNYVGEGVGHLLSEDADYRFLVYSSGVSVYNSSSTKITCAIAPCTVTLTIPINVASGTEVIEDLDSTLVYADVSNTFTYTYSDTSGDFSQARLYVYLAWPSNSSIAVACNNTKVTAVGVMTCDISSQVNGTYRAVGYITRTGDEFLDKQLSASLGTRIYNAMGLDGVLWGFFILMAVAMIGITRPSLAIIFSTVGLVTLSVLEIINIGALSIIAVSSIAIVLLMRIGKE